MDYTFSMLSPKTQCRLTNAKEYFEEHLCAGDYYSEGEKISGLWFGKGAESLHLTGAVKRDEFLRLCDNLDPNTGERLTQRFKTTRTTIDSDGETHTVANRRIFYDFTFSPPKSVSILALVGGDARILQAHERAIQVALKELERFAATRVHDGASISDHTTANVVCAIFRHDTSRALDPHLHSHCIVFNATHDPREARWKALQNYEMLKARKYVENIYYHELARELRQCGYQVENNPRGDFEVRGVSKQICDRFSKRHQEIDEKTRELLARKPHLANGNVKDIREGIAQTERSRKIKGIRLETLQSLWSEQISAVERETIGALKNGSLQKTGTEERCGALAAIAWAEEHLFDRRSVVPEYEIWRHALEYARGENIAIEELQEITRKRDYIRNERRPYAVTTREVLEREWEIVCMAKDGIGRFDPLSEKLSISDPKMGHEQRHAVEHILSSRGFVTLFRGGAGTGKSYALREVRAGLHTAGHLVHVIAPQRQQAIDLERDGFVGAQTVSEFLTKRQMPRGAVVIVDEAGQIGAKQMQQLLHAINDNEGRVILSGDTRQHGAVEASDALRAIERYAGIQAAEIQEIRRQDPARAKTEAERERIVEYRQAVKEASEGNLDGSFNRLEKLGAVVECPALDQRDRLAEEYLHLAAEKQSVVVVSQTWTEIHKVNERVRAALKAHHMIGDEDKVVTALEPVDLTDAQKRDKRFYTEESVLMFNRNAGGFKKGETGRMIAITANGMVVEGIGKIRTIRFKQLDRLTLCRRNDLALASGDRLQLKANATNQRGQRLANGELVTVERVLADGRIQLQDGRTLEANYRQFIRGFAITSYASQGKTVDYVLFSDSAIKPATNQQQWYVTISRGRKGIRIFTSDKTQLRECILRSGDRELAMNLADGVAIRRLGISPFWLRRIPPSRAYAFALSLRHRMRIFTAAIRNRAIQHITQKQAA